MLMVKAISSSVMSISDIQVFTDGSCDPNPGPGGWAAVLLFNQGQKAVELTGFEAKTTNNRMELLAAIKALEALENNARVELYTDSRYVQRGVTEWLGRWRQNGWVDRNGDAVKNRDLWETLAYQLHRHQVKWTWVKGHSTNEWNIKADHLAGNARAKGTQLDKSHSGVDLYLGVTWKKSTSTGSWSTILTYGDSYKILCGRENETTANRLYLNAAIAGIRALKKVLPVTIHTRSGYLRNGMSAWLDGWQKNDWKTREGDEISNKHQWFEISQLKQKIPITVISYPTSQPPCHALEAKQLAKEFH